MKKLLLTVMFVFALCVQAQGAAISNRSIGGLCDILEAGETTQILVGGGPGNEPPWAADLPTAITIGTKYIYRADGTDVPIADGGTNSSTALNNGRVMVSDSGSIIESATITATELGLLNGMASVSTGTGDNDKLVTQGYVDDNSGGDVSKVGTPADSQVGVWTGNGTIEGAVSFTYDGSNLQLTGDIGSTGTRITKGWFADLEVTNAIAGSVTGNAGTVTTITGLAPDTATTAATQANITSAANLATVGTIGTGVWQATDVGVAYGGTGVSTFALNGVLYGNGTSPIGATAIGAAGDILVAGADPFVPAWSSGTGTGSPVRATNPTLAGATLSSTLACADSVVERPKLKDYGEVINALGDLGGGTDDIDITAGNVVTATVSTGAETLTFSNPSASGTACSFTLILTNGGSQTVNWPASVDWAGGTAPTLTTSGIDILTFMTVDAGTTWYGFTAGLDMQ